MCICMCIVSRSFIFPAGAHQIDRRQSPPDAAASDAPGGERSNRLSGWFHASSPSNGQ